MSTIFEFGEVLADGDILVDLEAFDADVDAGRLGALLGIPAKEVLYSIIKRKQNKDARRALYKNKEKDWASSTTMLEMYLVPLRLPPFEDSNEETMWVDLKIRIDADPKEDPIDGWVIPKRKLHMPFSRTFIDTRKTLVGAAPKITRSFLKLQEAALVADIEDIEEAIGQFCKARDREARVVADCQEATAILWMAISVVEMQMDFLGLDYTEIHRRPRYTPGTWHGLLTALYELEDDANAALGTNYRVHFAAECRIAEQAAAIGRLSGYLRSPVLARRVTLLLQHPGDVSELLFQRAFDAFADAVLCIGSDTSGEGFVQEDVAGAIWEFLQNEPPDLISAAEATADPELREFLLDGWQDAFESKRPEAQGVLKAISVYGGGHRAATGVLAAAARVLGPTIVGPLARQVVDGADASLLKRGSAAFLRLLVGLEGTLHPSKGERYVSILLAGLSPTKEIRRARLDDIGLHKWFLRGERTAGLLVVINFACLLYAMGSDEKKGLEKAADVAANLARTGSELAGVLRVVKPMTSNLGIGAQWGSSTAALAEEAMTQFGKVATIYALFLASQESLKAIGRGDARRSAIHLTSAIGSGITMVEWVIAARATAAAAAAGPVVLTAAAVVTAASVVMAIAFDTSGPADTFDAYFRDHFSEHPRVKAMRRLLEPGIDRVDEMMGGIIGGVRRRFQDKFPTDGDLLRWHDAAVRGFGPRAVAALFKIDEATAKFYLDNVSVEWRK